MKLFIINPINSHLAANKYADLPVLTGAELPANQNKKIGLRQ